MIRKLIGTFAFTLLCAANANAATLTIGGPGSATVGNEFDITISGNFDSDGFIAGGINFFWDDTQLQLVGIVLNLPADESFSCPGNTNCPPNTSNSAPVVWGEFTNDLIAADAGDTLMATLTFKAIGAATEGMASFTMQTNDALTGGWFGAGFTSIPTPNFESYSMDINAAVVPLPAAVWFMVGGLGTLLGFRRK